LNIVDKKEIKYEISRITERIFHGDDKRQEQDPAGLINKFLHRVFSTCNGSLCYSAKIIPG
jgi:hypothetical protein